MKPRLTISRSSRAIASKVASAGAARATALKFVSPLHVDRLIKLPKGESNKNSFKLHFEGFGVVRWLNCLERNVKPM